MLQKMTWKFSHTVPLRDIADSIWQGDAIIGTDGSAANNHGTYAFTVLIHLNQDKPTVAVRCGGNLPELAEFIDMDSHRPEAAALYAGLCWIHHLLSCFVQPPTTGFTPTVPFVLDNKSVAEADLEWTFNSTTTSVFDYLKTDYDILQGILTVMEELPLTTHVRCVKGHQDKHKPREELSIAALANCIADDVCTETHHRHPSQVGRFPDWVPGTKAALMHNGKLVSKKHDEYVTTAATAPRLREYIIDRSQRRDPFIPSAWSDETFNDIDWKSVRSSFKSLSYGRRIQLSKFVHNWTPTNHHLANIDNGTDRRCFACPRRAWKEDIDHVLRCPSERRTTARDKALQAFRAHLSKYYTPAPMAQVIMHTLQ